MIRRELNDEIKKFVTTKHGKTYLKKSTFVFHGSLDCNLIENMANEETHYRIGISHGGIYLD
jgi:hypothetical protein